MSRIEEQILTSLLKNDDYVRTVLPYLKEDYFNDEKERTIFKEIKTYIEKYNSCPTKEAVSIALSNLTTVSEQQFSEIVKTLDEISKVKAPDELQWLVDETEKFTQDSAIHNGIMESIQILDGQSKLDKGAIPKILSDALAVSFDPSLGHDYLLDSDSRFAFYHKKENKLPFDLDVMNKATNGGVVAKTLNVILAGTGVGKTLIKCHLAANYLAQQKNVVYFTCEMAEERIAERIDANLMDVDLDDLRKLPESIYKKKIDALKKSTKGTLVVKEYPTATAHVGHFRHFLHELWLKKRIKPDVIFIDYINICNSERVRAGGAVNTYVLIKSIAEEFRGLAVEMNVPLWTSTQTNRAGFSNSDVSLENTSESFGLPATADLMFAAIRTEELDKLNQVMIKQLKNRYTDLTTFPRFELGVDRPKMKLYDLGATNSVSFATSSSSGNNAVDNSTLRTGGSDSSSGRNFKGFTF